MVHRAYARKSEAEVPTPDAWLKEIEEKALKEAEAKTIAVNFNKPDVKQARPSQVPSGAEAAATQSRSG